MKLYEELAEYWPLLSAPEDYAEEAAFYWRVMQGARPAPIRTVLELGSGGGNNASHMKAHAASVSYTHLTLRWRRHLRHPQDRHQSTARPAL